MITLTNIKCRNNDKSLKFLYFHKMFYFFRMVLNVKYPCEFDLAIGLIDYDDVEAGTSDSCGRFGKMTI